ncbi:hypothetical protein [Sphingobacterium lactis]|uniref:Uncharacterized protein n=1 Tax=Sphingobacterium lactis TaxID=797291 RepID=A0A1H6BR10_9SPHI|nr:hypothetical protein [Sphingobacterium lactis]SEG62646.1 hypothetical protein SAMN05421877_11144 [Sphingobacterium lactis]
MSKNIFQIQQEIAKENNVLNWPVLLRSLYGTMSSYDGMWLQLTVRYAQSQTQELIKQNRELIEMLEEIQIDLLNIEKPAIPDTQLCITISDLLTKCQVP